MEDNNIEVMLAPPEPGQPWPPPSNNSNNSTAVLGVGGISIPNSRDHRSNSSVSDSGVLLQRALIDAAAREVFLHKKQHLEVQHASRRPSAVSVGPVMVHQTQQQQQQQLQQQLNQAFLLRERCSGDEAVVTVRPVGQAVQGARAVSARVPSFLSASVTPPRIVVGSPNGGNNQRKRRSLDDRDIDYDSLLPPPAFNRRFSEAVNAVDVIAANRLEKAYAKYRRRAHAASDDTFAAATLEQEALNSDHERLSEWVRQDRERRRSCAVGEFASQAAARAKTPLLLPLRPGGVPRAERAHSSVGLMMVQPRGNNCDGTMEDQRSIRSASSYYNIERSQRIGSGGRRGSYLPKPNNQQGLTVPGQKVHRRRSRCDSIGKRHQQHQHSESLSPKLSLHDPASDLEAAAQRLLHEVAPGHPGLIVNDLTERAPPEKERRRMVLAVSCVALAITVFAALLVGLTLGMSHLLEDLTPGRKIGDFQASEQLKAGSTFNDTDDATKVNRTNA